MLCASEMVRKEGVNNNVIRNYNFATGRKHRKDLLPHVHAHGRCNHCFHAQTRVRKTWPEVPPMQVGPGCGICNANVEGRVIGAQSQMVPSIRSFAAAAR